ncbi:hypothetical protein TNCV_2422081 [Trichonephila clavipes]|nr:hypothetical protein TNCV_2422081 [Trichonephila clavipes]
MAKFRLLTGHDCLCAHLFRFNIVTSPICVLCDTGQGMTAAHLDECSALNDLNCIVKRHRATSPLVRLMEEEVRWEAPDSSRVSPLKLGWDLAKSYCHLHGAQGYSQRQVYIYSPLP